MGPQSLTDLFTNKRDLTNYNLREVSSSLQLPQPRTNNLKKNFSAMMERSFETRYLLKYENVIHCLNSKETLLLTLSQFLYK